MLLSHHNVPDVCLMFAVLPNSSSNSHKSESSVSVSTLVSKIGIMIAFLLSLVLENVEKPYGGWRWVIAAQYLR